MDQTSKNSGRIAITILVLLLIAGVFLFGFLYSRLSTRINQLENQQQPSTPIDSSGQNNQASLQLETLSSKIAALENQQDAAGPTGPRGFTGAAGLQGPSGQPGSNDPNVALLDRDSQIFTGNNAVFKNAGNTATAFQLQNSAGMALLIADSSNSRIYIGGPVADGMGVTLVLDSKNTAGDPTGVDGAMYYNSNLGAFRCYQNGSWRNCVQNSRSGYYYSNDFTFGSTGDDDLQVNLNAFGGGASSVSTNSGEAGRPGVLTGRTQNSGSQGGVISDGDILLLGNGDTWAFETAVKIPTLSDGTNTFTVRAGFSDNNAGDPADGCFFRYTNGTNGGKWQGVCRNNSTESTCDSGISVAAGTWYRLGVVVNSSGTSADFLTDGTSRCQVTTNIPTGAGRVTGFNVTNFKSAGTSQRDTYIDYIEVIGNFASPR